MKEELQGKLVEILTSIQAAAGKAGDIAAAQLPEIAQQYVAFARAYHTLWVVLMAGALVGIGIATLRAHRLASRPEGAFGGMPPGLAFMFGGIAAVLPFTIFMDSMKPALMVWFAPKVWLLKEIATLLK